MASVAVQGGLAAPRAVAALEFHIPDGVGASRRQCVASGLLRRSCKLSSGSFLGQGQLLFRQRGSGSRINAESPFNLSTKNLKEQFSGPPALISPARLQYIDQHRSDGTARVPLYWALFGVTTAVGALGVDFAVQRLTGMDSGSAGLAFAGLVGGLSGFQFLKLRFLSGKQGSGAYISQSMGAKEVTSRQAPELVRVVEELAQATSMPMPRVFILPRDEPNAFAAGFDTANDATITVTEGLLKRLNKEELKAVLAHEVGHIIHGDMKSGTHLAAMLGGFYGAYSAGRLLLASTFQRQQFGNFASRGGRNARDEQASAQQRALAGGLIGVGLITYVFGMLFQFGVSRQKEFAADATGSALVNPEAMKSALQKISAKDAPHDVQTSASHRQYAHLWTNGDAKAAISETPVVKTLANLLMTHPPLEARLANIDKVADELRRLE